MSFPTYDFDTVLLSAVKSGNPPMTNTTTESAGVSVLQLAPDAIGVTFNAKSTLNGTTNTVSLSTTATSFEVDTAYNGSHFAFINKTSNNTITYTFVRYMSSDSDVDILPDDTMQYDNITGPFTRRLWHLGYI